MIELIKYFRVLFLSHKLSTERLKNFTEDHIQRLTANNPGGIFTSILTAITTAYNNYFGDMSSKSLNQAVQEGKTKAMNESREALIKQLSDNEKLIAYTYKDNKPAYEEFYPLGITEYRTASLSALETISGRYKEVLTAHAADFTPAFISAYNTVQATFVANRAAQQTAFGNVAAERSDLTATRTALATQLTTNLLTIALQYVGDETKADEYFNQSILNAAFAESNRKVAAEINPTTTHNIFNNITKGTVTLLVKNTGTTPLYIGFTENETEPVNNNEDKLLPPGAETGTTAAQGGWTTTRKYLNITNYSMATGSYEARKL
jgi:hypothetical protein